MTGTVRLGVLGTGAMARTMIAAVAGVDGLEVAGIASRTAARAAEVAAAYGVAAAGFDALLADSGIDAIYIATEPALHADAVIRALTAGKAVLCEKPCAIDGDQAARIAEAAAATGALFMEAVATPFLPAVAVAVETARGGGLGVPRHLDASFGYPITRASHPVCFAGTGGGVLLDRAIYLVTLSRLLFGPVAAADAAIRRDADGIDIHAAFRLEHDGGTAQLTASFDARLGNDAAIGCTGGVIRLAEPLLSCERMVMSAARAPAGRVTAAAPGLVGRLKERPQVRRARAMAGGLSGQFVPYGASPYAPELAHFRDLVLAGARESPVLPPSLTVEIHRTLSALRGA